MKKQKHNMPDKLCCTSCGSQNLSCPNDGYIYCKDCGDRITVIDTLINLLSHESKTDTK